jgi:hypothetical protein
LTDGEANDDVDDDTRGDDKTNSPGRFSIA